MKIWSSISRSVLLAVMAVACVLLPACSTSSTGNPGPHQDNGMIDPKDGKDHVVSKRHPKMVGNPAPHQ